MTVFSLRLVHRGGAVDDHRLDAVATTHEAIRTARTYLLVSPSAVTAEVFVDGAHERRISRTDGLSDDLATG